MTEANPAKIRYKPRHQRLHIDDDGLLDKLFAVATLRPTWAEAAAALGVCRETFRKFIQENPAAREAWDDGRQICKMSLRRLLFMHARNDPATARYLSKQLLGMSDDPSKAKLDEVSGEAVRRSISAKEAEERIIELAAKVIGERTASPKASSKALVRR